MGPGGEGGRFGGGKRLPMMGVKRSVKKRPRSRRTEPFCLSRRFARRSLCILPNPIREASAIPSLLSIAGPTWRTSRGRVRVYSTRNTQDARNYGLSIISYVSRYLLNIGVYFSGELACRGERETGVLRVKNR